MLSTDQLATTAAQAVSALAYEKGGIGDPWRGESSRALWGEVGGIYPAWGKVVKSPKLLSLQAVLGTLVLIRSTRHSLPESRVR